MPDADLAATLDEIRELIAARDALAACTTWATADRLYEFNAAQDKLAARVPFLLKGVEDALKAADNWDAQGLVLRAGVHGDCARELREAITAALTGTQPSEDGNRG